MPVEELTDEEVFGREFKDAEVFAPERRRPQEFSDADVGLTPLEDNTGRYGFGGEEVGAVGGLVNSLRRGVSAAQSVFPAIEMAGAGGGKPTMGQAFRGFQGAMDDPRYMESLMEAHGDPARQSRVESMLGARARTDGLAARNAAIRDIWTGVVADAARERERLPRSQAQQELATTDDKWGVFFKYPAQTIASIALESLPPSIAGAVIGAPGGPAGVAAGVGASSAATEFANSFLDEASRQGFDPTDQRQLAAFVDGRGYDQAFNRALARATIVGEVDAATAGQAGRFIKPALREGIGRILSATGKEIGMQAVGGAGGELTAQVATRGDRPIDWFDVAMEAAAEVAGAPAEVYANIRHGVNERAEDRQSEPVATLRPDGNNNRQLPSVTEKATPPPASVTPSALSELEAAMRGNQVRPSRRPEPEPMPAAPEPVVIREQVGEPVTQQDLENREYMRLKDQQARETVADRGKDYRSMSDDDLELLAALGDDEAKRVRRRRRAEVQHMENKARVGQELSTAYTSVPPRSTPSPELSESEVMAPPALTPPSPVAESPQSPTGPATITGPAVAAENEGKASVMPAETGESPAPVRTVRSRRGSNRPPDIIDHIQNTIGKIKSVSAAKEGNESLYDAAKEIRQYGAARKILSSASNAIAPDVALHSLIQDRFLPEGATIDDFWDAIADAAKGRQGDRKTSNRENALIEVEERQHLDFVKTGLRRHVAGVPVTDLIAGDKFTLNGVEVRVKDFDLDENGDVIAVILDDGRRFGTQRVGAEQVIRPDKGSLQHTQNLDFAPTQETRTRDSSSPTDSVSPKNPQPVQPVVEADSGRPAVGPKIKSGQNQGDLLGSGDIPFNLYGEQTQSGERIAGERAEREETQKAAKEFEAKNQPDLVERALDALKLDIPPGVQAFGIVPDLWNRAIEIIRVAYRAGKTIAQAIDDGIALLRKEHKGPMDEAQVRKGMERVLKQDKPDLIREKIRPLEARMAEHEAKGEPIPQELLDEYKALADELGEEIRGGRAKMGAESRVDRDIQPRERPKGPQAPAKIPPWKGEERLPRGNPMRTLWAALRSWRESTGNWLSRRGARADIAMGRDAGDTRAARLANEASLHVRLLLNRAFGDKGSAVRRKNEAREAALTFIVEADADRGTLQDFWEAIANSPAAETNQGRRAMAAIEYANTHWDKLQEAAEAYRQISAIERETELNEGVNSHEWKGSGYVYHRWKRDAPTGADPTQARPAGTPFRHSRSVATYAEGIAAGRDPVTLNGLELLSERVNSGQRRLNELRWVHGLRNMEDPATGAPVVTDVIKKPRRPVGLPTPDTAEPGAEESNEAGYKPEIETTAPEGYTIFKSGDVELAVLNNFHGLLTKLTSPSFFKNAPVKKVFGFIKSALLLFDTFHLGRMAAWRQMFGLGGGYRKGQTLLDFSTTDIRQMAERGEIPKEWAEGLVENKRRLELAVDTGFNVGSILDNSWSDLLHKIPGIGDFNHWLFGQYQRGAMAEAWLIEFERMRRALPNATEQQVARKVSRDLNSRFGNLGRQGIFKSRTAQDLARFVFLAPQWNESLIRSEIGAGVQTLTSPITSIQQRRLVAGTLMKSTGMMALGTFLANQVLNYAFRGKPTWDNDEEGWDKKISAYIPDAISGGPGFFLNPLALPAEYTHLIEGNLHRSGGGWAETAKRILNSRLHSASRAAFTLFTRQDELGRKLREGEVFPAMARAMLPIPIAAPTAFNVAKQVATGERSESFPGQYQKQAMASFGVKTDQAPTAQQRIGSLARQFNKSKGIVPSAEFYTGDFSDLDKALRIGNMSDARDEMADLLKKKTPDQIAKHYERFVGSPFTGSAAREGQFYQGLTTEQKERYREALEARRRTAIAARKLLAEMVRRAAP